MTGKDFTRRILKRLGKLYWLILLIGIGAGFLLYQYAKGLPVKYVSKATLYALTNKEVSATGGLIGTLTGGSDGSMGKLSDEASISLDELANSRRIRESVAATKLPEFKNQTIASLLIQNEMKHQPFYATKVEMPKTEIEVISLGTSLIYQYLTAKTTKGDLFQINFTSTAQELVSPVTYVFIDKLTSFFIALKVKKAQSDYDFTLRKIDSLQSVMAMYDRKAININNSTMFVPPGKIEYEIPKENLINDKTRVVGIYNGAANNKEEALWRLQRAKPILDLLDRPEPPFAVLTSSPKKYALIGFIIGCVIGLFLSVLDIILKYLKAQLHAVIADDETAPTVITTTKESQVTHTAEITTLVQKAPEDHRKA